MARNKVQHQKGLSEAEFDRRYGSEEQCRAAVVKWRWPDGFVCPECGGRRHSLVKTRALYQCTTCRRQTSLTAGTIFAATKLSLRSWVRALYHLTQSKQGISSLELGRRLGVTQSTAWTVKHKLKQVMMERDAKKRLIGRVEMDDADLGGRRSGGKRGRGAAGKTPIVASVRPPPRAGRCASNCAGCGASGARRSKPWPGAAWMPPAPSSAMLCRASAASPRPAARTSRSAPAPAAKRC